MCDTATMALTQFHSKPIARSALVTVQTLLQLHGYTGRVVFVHIGHGRMELELVEKNSNFEIFPPKVTFFAKRFLPHFEAISVTKGERGEESAILF